MENPIANRMAHDIETGFVQTCEGMTADLVTREFLYTVSNSFTKYLGNCLSLSRVLSQLDTCKYELSMGRSNLWPGYSYNSTLHTLNRKPYDFTLHTV